MGYQVVLKEALPGGVGQLGQHEEQREEVGQPEVVRGDGGVLVIGTNIFFCS